MIAAFRSRVSEARYILLGIRCWDSILYRALGRSRVSQSNCGGSRETENLWRKIAGRVQPALIDGPNQPKPRRQGIGHAR